MAAAAAWQRRGISYQAWQQLSNESRIVYRQWRHRKISKHQAGGGKAAKQWRIISISWQLAISA